VPNCKSSLVTEAERKRVRRRARFQQHENKSCNKDFFLARQGAESNSRYLDGNIREYAPPYATVKTVWPSLNMVIFPPVMRLVLDDPKQ